MQSLKEGEHPEAGDLQDRGCGILRRAQLVHNCGDERLLRHRLQALQTLGCGPGLPTGLIAWQLDVKVKRGHGRYATLEYTPRHILGKDGTADAFPRFALDPLLPVESLLGQVVVVNSPFWLEHACSLRHREVARKMHGDEVACDFIARTDEDGTEEAARLDGGEAWALHVDFVGLMCNHHQDTHCDLEDIGWRHGAFAIAGPDAEHRYQ